MDGFVIETQHPDASAPGGVRTTKWAVVAPSHVTALIVVGVQGARIVQSGPEVLALARSLGVPDEGCQQI